MTKPIKPPEPGLYLCDQRGEPLRHPIYFDGDDGWYGSNHLVWWDGDDLSNFRRLVPDDEAAAMEERKFMNLLAAIIDSNGGSIQFTDRSLMKFSDQQPPEFEIATDTENRRHIIKLIKHVGPRLQRVLE